MEYNLNVPIIPKAMGTTNVGSSLTFFISFLHIHAGLFDCSGKRITDNVSYIICLVLHPDDPVFRSFTSAW